MNDEPERLLSGGGTEFERTLLRSVMDEAPSSTSMKKAAVALAAATGASTFTKTLWAARDFVQPLAQPLAGSAGKLIAGTVLAGATTYLAVTQSSLPPAPETDVELPRVPAAASTPTFVDEGEAETDVVHLNDLRDELEGAEVQTEVELDQTPARVARSATGNRSAGVPPEGRSDSPARALRGDAKVGPPPSDASSAAQRDPSSEKVLTIADEIVALDAARRTLDGGNPLGALRELDAYNQKFGGGRLGQEAMVVRIRALVQAGRNSQAQALADGFRAQNPHSPYTKRIDSIVSAASSR